MSVITNTAHTTATITNTLATGYASSYLNAGGVSGQLFVGGGSMNIGTNTNHPLRFATNRFTNPTSLTIEADGTLTCASGMCSASDSRLKDNQTLASLTDLQAIFDAVEVKTYERNDLNICRSGLAS